MESGAMAEITASAVKSLRDRTGAGMMDCKRALEEAGGDEERAIDLLRQRGAAKAAKRAERDTSEGAVQISTADGRAAMVEVASETDFVARSDDFVEFSAGLAEAVRGADVPEGEVLGGEDFLSRDAAEAFVARLNELRARVGENVQLGRVVRLAAGEGGAIGSYVHFGNRIGVLVEVGGAGEAGEELARELALHIAAAAPVAVRPEDLPEEMRERERRVLSEQARQEGKPENIVEKMVEGRMRKFYEEHALIEQGFVKDPDRKISTLLADAGEGAEVRRFFRFEVGA